MDQDLVTEALLAAEKAICEVLGRSDTAVAVFIVHPDEQTVSSKSNFGNKELIEVIQAWVAQAPAVLDAAKRRN